MFGKNDKDLLRTLSIIRRSDSNSLSFIDHSILWLLDKEHIMLFSFNMVADFHLCLYTADECKTTEVC